MALLPAGADVVINEINYHPYEPYPVSTNLTEFVELYNPGPSAVNLAGYRFDNGISYTFSSNQVLAAGSYGVLCENRAVFTNAYTTVTNVLGQYGGGLANAGERVTLSKLVSTNWVTVDTIKYDDVGLSDGDGRSLELVNSGFARLSNYCHGAWAVSTTVSGTPGRVNSAYAASPAPVIADVAQDPPLPPAGSAITITARVAAYDSDVLRSVMLKYRRDENPKLVWQFVQMEDTGRNGDAVAGDGVYSTRVPLISDTPLPEGEVLEWQIEATDSRTAVRTEPAENTSGTVAGPYSYLAWFGTDANFNGEYETYHILLTESNKTGSSGLEVRSTSSDVLLDCTLVTADGHVFYNASVRYRGGSSRNQLLGGYRVELPAGRNYLGHRQISLNHNNALSQYIGMKLAGMIGEQSGAYDVGLSRVWVNQSYKDANQHIYLRMETFSRTVISRAYPDDTGNLYTCDGDGIYDGNLSYTADINEYRQNSTGSDLYNYMCDTGNPATVWYDIQELCRVGSRPTSELPTVLGTKMNYHQWARLYALQACIGNNEAGWLCPYATSGDEVRLYHNPTSGLFDLWAWDQDSIVLENTAAGTWLWNLATTRNFLFNRPMAPSYVGDVLDILSTVMTPATMTALFDSAGSAMTPSLRTTYQNNLSALRASIVASISTNLTCSVNGTPVAQGQTISVAAATASLTGLSPQNYTTTVRVNGVAATWTAHDVNNMAATYGAWQMPAFALSASAVPVTVQAVNASGAVLKSLSFYIAKTQSAVTKSGTISTDTTWTNPGGVIQVTANVSVTSGAKLTIPAGNTILMTSGTTLSAGTGRIAVQGTSPSPVYFLPATVGGTWTLSSSGAGSVAGITNAVLSGGTVTAASSGALVMEDSALRNNAVAGGIVQTTGGASATLRRCIVDTFAKTRFDSSTTWIEDCLFTNMTDAAVELIGGTATVKSSSVQAPTAVAAVDGLRLQGGVVAIATNCLVARTRGEALDVSGTGTRLSLTASLVYGAATGVKRASPATVTGRNNTVSGCTTAMDGAQTVTNLIVWANTNSVANGPVTATYSDIQQTITNAYAGTGNINRNPWFRDAAARDYRLQSISPCIATGSGGKDMGAIFPVGGLPAAPDTLTLVGSVTGATSQVRITWRDRSSNEENVEVERSSDGGAAWQRIAVLSANVTNATDSTVAENVPYAYRVRATHRRGASLYSEVATITASLTTRLQSLIDNLRLTEIMYNPSGSSDDEEFLEFKNISATVTLDLSGLRLDNGRYVFASGKTLAPHGFYVIARNGSAFTARYGVPYQGVYLVDDKLDNAGETLWVEDAQSNRIYTATYNDAWYPTTDNGGYSLVPVNPNPTGDPDAAAYWRASGAAWGSPGADDPPAPYATIVINEVLAHTDPPLEDAIELHNTGTSSVDISGWYLSNASTNLKRYRIPTRAAIPAGGYTVLYEGTSFNSNTNDPACFEISSLGDELYLSSSSGTNLTGFRASVKFGATANGMSLGRYVRSDGEVDFAPMSARTFGVDSPSTVTQFRTGTGLTNSAPYVPPVVINEIMYNPSAGGKEYVELYNRTGAPVPLFDSAHPTNAWRFDGAMDYTFPTGITVAAGERILVSGVTPAEFRAALGITNLALRVFGPFVGDLNNAGETVKMYQPDPPEANGFVPYVLIEKVQYSDQLPWPTAADNGGPSLERINPAAYANDPTNWVAATVGGTPGAANNTSGQPSVGFELVDSSVDENIGTVQLGVAIEPVATAGPVTVYYSVSAGSATAGSDFTAATGSLLFWPYDTRKTVPVTITPDAVALETNETVVITLTGISSGGRLGGRRTHTLTIRDTTLGTVAAPVAVPSGGTFYRTVEVALSCATPHAAIYYTLDGTSPRAAYAAVAGAYVPSSTAALYTGPLLLQTSVRMKAFGLVGSYSASPEAVVQFSELAPSYEYPPDTFVRRVALGSDDADEKFGFKSCDVTNNYLRLGNNASPSYRAWYAGLRFTNLSIPRGSIVTNAYIQFTAQAPCSGTLTHKIYAEATNTPATFQALSANISKRIKTAAFVNWTPAAWMSADQAGVDQRTPDLSAVIQEIVDRPAWDSGHDMAILISLQNDISGAARLPHSANGNAERAAMLLIQLQPQPPVADADGDGMNDAWEIKWFGSTNAVSGGPNDDWDEDGFVNYSEFVADTIPTDNRSLLVLTGVEPLSNGWRVIWQSVTSRWYSIFRSGNIGTGWGAGPVVSNLPGSASGTNTYSDAPNLMNPVYYRIGVQQP